MSTNQGDNAAHPPLSQEMAAHLLDLLSEDDAFRELFTRDPEQALIRAGLSPAEAAQALCGDSCMRVTTLASKEAIRAAREQLLQNMTSEAAHTVVFCFND